MFERYTEKARRIIFFGRYEASEFGCELIEADCLLLGIARENPELCIRWLAMNYTQLRERIAELYPRKSKLTASTDLPLSNASKRVLAYAAEEADRLGDRHIGSEHLFLGLLREGGTASEILKARHEDLKSVRKAISKDPDRQEMTTARSRGSRMGLQIKLAAEDGTEIAVIPLATLPESARRSAFRTEMAWKLPIAFSTCVGASRMSNFPVCRTLSFCSSCDRNGHSPQPAISSPASVENLKK